MTTTAPRLVLADTAVEASTYNPGLVTVHVAAIYLVPGVRVHDGARQITVTSVEWTEDGDAVTVDMDDMVATFSSEDHILTLTVTPEYAAEVVANAI